MQLGALYLLTDSWQVGLGNITYPLQAA